MANALRETRVSGVHTTLDLCRAIMNDEAFRAGGVSVEYLPSFAATTAAAT
jgi:biotin carboxylase